MINIKHFAAPLAILLTLNLSCCDKDENVNPCATLHPVTANFEIIESYVGGFPSDYPFFDTDTIAGDYVMFRAMEEDAQYEWTLGSEIITTQSFTRHSFPRGQKIPVSLKVYKEPNNKCFPEDDGEDVQSREFYVTNDYQCDSNVNGVFVGKNVDGTEEREVEIEVCRVNPVNPDYTDLRINNLIDGCEAIGFATTIIGYSQIYFKANCCDANCFFRHGSGYATLSETNSDSIKIEYQIDDVANSGSIIKKTFNGIRK